MTDALRVSSDLYFYRMGQYLDRVKGDPLQKWAADYGFGSDTGIDLPSERPGLRALAALAQPPLEAGDQAKLALRYQGRLRPAQGCYEIADRPWSPGDNMNLAVGQGDLQATPLQLAVAYAAIANGGDVVRPHLAMQSEDPLGRIDAGVQPGPRPPPRHLVDDAEHDPRGPARGRAAARRHLLRRLRRLPGRASLARPVPRSTRARRTSPGTRHTPRATTPSTWSSRRSSTAASAPIPRRRRSATSTTRSSASTGGMCRLSRAHRPAPGRLSRWRR